MLSLLRTFSLVLICLLLIASSDAAVNMYGYGSGRSLAATQSSSTVNVSPGAYQTPDAGDTLAVTGISNTGHGSTLTSASAADIESQPSKNITQMKSARWSSFQSGSSGVIIGLKLKFDWTASGNVNASVEAGGSASARIDFNIDYSIDGGSSWTNALSRFRVVNQSGNGGKTDSISDGGSVEVVLSASQNISLVQVRDFMRSNAVANAPSVSGAAANSSARITTSVSGVSLEVEMVNCVASVPADRWKGEYFDNQTLSGSPTMARDDSAAGTDFLNLNFGAGSPHSLCAPRVDDFSARWTRTVNFAQGIYRFTTSVDNGVRLYVDGYPRIDKWGNLAPNTYTADVFLDAGNHDIKLEFIEYTGGASVSLSWTTVSGANCVASVPAGQWKGEYYSNTNLAGSPAMVRNDGGGFLSFNFGSGSPGSGCGLGEDYFSARWTRTVNLAQGIYRFSVTGDDGVRLYVDGQLVINKWFIQAATTYTANVTLSSAGPRQVTLEYFESSGSAVAILSWTLVTAFNCLPDVPLIGNAPRIGGGESIATTPVSGATKPCGQKKSD